MSNLPEIFNTATRFSDIDLKGDNKQIRDILDKKVVIEGFNEDGNSMTFSIINEDGISENIWTSSAVIISVLKKIPKNNYPVLAIFREHENKYYFLE